MRMEITQRKFVFYPLPRGVKKTQENPHLCTMTPDCVLAVAIREIIFLFAGLHHPAAISVAE